MIEFFFSELPDEETVGSITILSIKYEQIDQVDAEKVTDKLDIISAKSSSIIQNDSMTDALTDSLDIIGATLKYSVITLNRDDVDSVRDSLNIIASRHHVVDGVIGVDSMTDTISIIDGELTWV